MLADFAYYNLIAALIIGIYIFINSWVRPTACIIKPNELIILQFFLVSFSFGILIYSFVISDLSLALVVKNSHIAKPLLYKITGSWGNHEGSILLWTWELSLLNFIFQIISKYNEPIKSKILGLQSLILSGFLGFVAFASNPFLKILPVPSEGLGLNPILQDIGLAIHPPILYAGYIGCSILFSHVMAELKYGKFEALNIERIRPYLLATWGLLTLGILLGSWWAYRELGWGGYWFWDPVENISLTPWLSLTALLHALPMVRSKKIAPPLYVITAIISFIFGLFGTFLVRSGILTSVHSFAVDPARGTFILIYLMIVVFGSIANYFAYINKSEFAVNKKTMQDKIVLLNNVLLLSGAFIIVIAILYPIFINLTQGKSISIGGNYFIDSFLPMMIVLIYIAPFGLIKNIKKLLLILISSIIIILSLNIADNVAKLALIGALFLIMALLSEYKKFNLTLLVHLSFGMLVLAVTINAVTKKDRDLVMRIEEQISFADYKITLKSIDYDYGSNYLTRKYEFYVENHKGDEIAILAPETRFFPVEKITTEETAIYTHLMNDLYIAIGEYDSETNEVFVRFYHKPLMKLIWISGMMMSITSLLLIRKKYVRVG